MPKTMCGISNFLENILLWYGLGPTAKLAVPVAEYIALL